MLGHANPVDDVKGTLQDQRGHHTNPVVSPQYDRSEYEISKLEEHNHNAAPLCRLPAEVLALILIHWQLDVMDEIGLDYELNVLLIRPWLASVSICRSIWAVAVQTPELWSTIHVGRYNVEHTLRWIDLCCARGRDFTLHIQTKIKPYSDIIPVLRSRTRLLFVYEYDPSEDHDFGKFSCLVLQEEWPALELMEMQSVQWPSMRSVYAYAPILGGLTERLTTLRLIDCDTRLLWTLPPFPKLQHLILSITNVDESSIESLVEILSREPPLISLTVDFSTFWYLDPQSQDTTLPAQRSNLHFPALRSLTIRGHASLLLYLLDVLPRPLDDLSIDIRWFIDNHDAMSLISSARQEIGRIIDRALSYSKLPVVEDQQEGSRMYKVIFAETEMTGMDYFDYELISWNAIPFTLVPCEPEPPQGRRSFNLIGVCDRENIPRVIQAACTVEIGALERDHFKYVLQAVAQANSVEHLQFTTQSPVGPTRTQSLEACLRGRSAPLVSLTVNMSEVLLHANELVQRIERWMDEGLVKDIHITSGGIVRRKMGQAADISCVMDS